MLCKINILSVAPDFYFSNRTVEGWVGRGFEQQSISVRQGHSTQRQAATKRGEVKRKEIYLKASLRLNLKDEEESRQEGEVVLGMGTCIQIRDPLVELKALQYGFGTG